MNESVGFPDDVNYCFKLAVSLNFFSRRETRQDTWLEGRQSWIFGEKTSKRGKKWKKRKHIEVTLNYVEHTLTPGPPKSFFSLSLLFFLYREKWEKERERVGQPYTPNSRHLELASGNAKSLDASQPHAGSVPCLCCTHYNDSFKLSVKVNTTQREDNNNNKIIINN